MRIGLFAGVILVSGGLGGCQAFDADSVDLSGMWLLSDSTVFPMPSGPFNTCLVRNVRLEIHAGPPTGMFARTRPGGTQQCEINGVWQSPHSYDIDQHYSISREDERIVFQFSNRPDTIYTGDLGSNDRMGGAVHPQGRGGRQGTWRAIRD